LNNSISYIYTTLALPVSLPNLSISLNNYRHIVIIETKNITDSICLKTAAGIAEVKSPAAVSISHSNVSELSIK
jgi:hypothetical protein